MASSNTHVHVSKYSSYNQIAGLKADELKKLCVTNNVDPKLPKKARIILVCHIVGISTVGTNLSGNVCLHSNVKSLTSAQRHEYEKLTVKNISQITEWTKDLYKLPAVEDKDKKTYLLNTEQIDEASVRTYKLSRPYQLKQFVHSVEVNENMHSETFIILKAQCNPSQATSADEIKLVYVVLDKITGTPYGGFCTCTVGCSQTCGHIGAVLFAVADALANGTWGTKACTEELCAWTDHKGSKCSPSLFSEIAVMKQEKTLKRTTQQYGKTLLKNTQPTKEALMELRANLLMATHHTGQYCPAVHVLHKFSEQGQLPSQLYQIFCQTTVQSWHIPMRL
ncbi:uncharacterized protein LOC127878902 [Dreissena polymorpha]|uniref:uncharacterized protein LOC127878902 n=1 Tax=Dreissena polymorpha TaxID=45954 RepID=UPI0022646854|nr:uncharacterized protein LOC127878902 [Dreissena polymorpha]